MVGIAAIKTNDGVSRPVRVLADDNVHLIRPGRVDHVFKRVDSFGGGVVTIDVRTTATVLNCQGTSQIGDDRVNATNS